MTIYMRKIFIIAEAGVNHNNDLNMAFKMIDEAQKAGADAVKFQSFKARDLVSIDAPKAAYQNETTDRSESHYEMIKKLELSSDMHYRLKEYCELKKIIFLSTPFDLPSIDFLNNMGLKIFKIPSGEITNLPYLRKVGGLRKKIILSTGMSDLKEIKKAVGVLTDNGTKKKDITVLQCNTQYPTPYNDVNLKAMLTIGRRLGVNTGYSDHTPGIEVPIAAAALGATVIEKHFTLDEALPGPDHKASLSLEELKAMIQGIRNIETALGNSVKKLTASESRNKQVVRKSIVAAQDIKKGDVFTAENLAVKRPATGISPMQWDRLIGKKAGQDFKKDELIVYKA